MAAAVLCVTANLVILSAHPQNAPPAVTRVDPPSWWANHTINPVRLLVRGRNLTGARVRSTSPLQSVSNVVVNREGTYVFANLNISSRSKPGSFSLVLETASGSTTIPFTIEKPLDEQRNFRGITTEDVIYLIMVDRFANGDPANDSPAGAPPAATDRSNPRAYHGGDLRGIIDHLQYLKDLGVTALWLTPWYDNWNGIMQCDKPWCPGTYYHGYHAIDYYRVEDHFGNLNTLQELVSRAHGLGLKIIQDQVANHVGSQHPWIEDPPLNDWFHGTLQQHQRNKFNNSVLLSPHGNREEVRNTLDGWFSEDLPDMNQDQSEVARYEIQNALWWIGVSGIDGVRQDTIQYMPRAFIRDLSQALHRQYPRMWIVGEVFERDAAQTAFFMGGKVGWDNIDTNLDSDFDFSLWDVSLQVFTGKRPVRTLRDQLKYDALYPDAARVTTLVNNHDTPRFMSLAGATLEGAMLHTAFTLSVRGIPQLYYGEELAMDGGEDPENRRDFPGGFPGDTRNAFSEQGRTRTEQRIYDWTRRWINLRREHSSIRHGRLIDLFYDNDAYVFARQDNSETLVIAFNRKSQEEQVTLPAGAIGLRDGDQLRAVLGAVDGGKVAKGLTTLTLPARTAVALKAVR